MLKIVTFIPFWLVKILFQFFASQLRWYAFLGIILGGLMTAGNFIFLNKAVVVTGIYIQYEITYLAGRNFASVRPQFKYIDRQGNQLINTTNAVPSDYLLTMDEAVRLLMDPDKPSRIEIEAEFNPLIPGGYCGPRPIGAVFTALAQAMVDEMAAKQTIFSLAKTANHQTCAHKP